MRISYELIEFPSPFTNGNHQLDFTWLEVIHAAITLGRRNWNDVISHPNHSIFEMVYRMSMAEAFLEADPLRISPAYLTLDPTEKGTVNYFVAGIITLIFARKLFDTPYLMHLDVYERNLYHSLSLNITYRANERPDFVGINNKNNYVIFESKGRVKYSRGVLDKAYKQTESIGTVNGKLPVWRIGCVAYHENDTYKVKLIDPKEHDKKVYNVKFEIEKYYLNYYSVIFHLLNENKNHFIEKGGFEFIVSKNIYSKYVIGLEKGLYFEMRDHIENYVPTSFKKLINRFRNKVQENKTFYIGSDGIYIEFTD